jgi:RHS repeat-associated protein
VAEHDANGNPLADYTAIPAGYGRPVSQHRDGESHVFLTSGIHDVTQLTDATGHVSDDARYDAWGKLLASTGSTATPYGYKGELGYYRDPELDLSTGAGNESSFYLHHRLFDPATSRFRSEDPAADDLNLYRYVNNNPVNRQDPSGLLDPQKLKESLATYDPLALEYLADHGIDIVAYSPTTWESFAGWSPLVKVGNDDDAIRYHHQMDAGQSNWSAFQMITQRVRLQSDYKEWKQKWLESHGVKEERETIWTPPPDSPEYATFMRKLAKQDHQMLLDKMREIGATESEISSEEWRPFAYEFSRPGGVAEQLLTAAASARTARAGIRALQAPASLPTIASPPRSQIVPIVPPGPFKAPVNRPELGPHVKDVVAPKSGLGGATRLTPEELVTGQRLESQLGKTLRESPHIGAEYVDDLGRSYDALGTPNASKFWSQKKFLASIDGHLLKSNDFTVIDLTGFTPAQIAAVNSHLATLTTAQLARIIRIGF